MFVVYMCKVGALIPLFVLSKRHPPSLDALRHPGLVDVSTV